MNEIKIPSGTTVEDICAWLRRRREASGLSQEELAGQAGRSRSRLWEAERRADGLSTEGMSLETLLDFNDALAAHESQAVVDQIGKVA